MIVWDRVPCATGSFKTKLLFWYFFDFPCMCNISRCWDWWCSNSFRKQWHRTATLLQRESGGFELFGWILQQKLTGHGSSRPSEQTRRSYNLGVPTRGQGLGFLRSCFWRSAWTASRFVAFLELVGVGLSLKIDQSRSKLPIWMDVCGSGRSWPPRPHGDKATRAILGTQVFKTPQTEAALFSCIWNARSRTSKFPAYFPWSVYLFYPFYPFTWTICWRSGWDHLCFQWRLCSLDLGHEKIISCGIWLLIPPPKYFENHHVSFANLSFDQNETQCNFSVLGRSTSTTNDLSLFCLTIAYGF